MDFGRLGLVWDPVTERRWVARAQVIVLSHSRHSFVWPIFHQKLTDVIEGLEAAWSFFYGNPKYLVIDFSIEVTCLHPRRVSESQATGERIAACVTHIVGYTVWQRKRPPVGMVSTAS